MPSTMPITINGEEYLNTTESCDFLGVSLPTFTKLVKRHRLQAMRQGVGRAIYYKKADLQPILELRPATDDDDA